MENEFSHARIDRINAGYDRRIAARLRRDGRLLRAARENLKRWMIRDGRTVRPVFDEWSRILTRLTRVEIADFLKSETPLARRLRQSSPFAGLLTGHQPRNTRQRHAKART